LVPIPSPEDWLVVRTAYRLAPQLRDRPDKSRAWIAPATRAATSLAAKGDYAGLITFAQPWSDHLAGLRISRATRLPWVAHFSDPWTDSPYATDRQRSIWQPMEAEVIENASAIVFVTTEAADLVMSKYPSAWKQKVFVVPHGFDRQPSGVPLPHPNDQVEVNRGGPLKVNRGGPMKLVYTGRFYQSLRTPIPLLRALAGLKSRDLPAGTLEVSFIGPFVEEFQANAMELGVGEIVRFAGRVSPAAASAAAATADVLLVIDAPSQGPSVFLPSKLIDYLAFRKPILGITPAVGASADLLRRLGCSSAPPEDVGAIGEALADLVRRKRNGTLEVGESFDRVASEFTADRTATRLNEVLTIAFAG
jgi:glycosyltransferase involved in cell wall biosynthesis